MSHGWKRCAGSVRRSLPGRSPGARPRHGYVVKRTSAEDSTLPGMSARPKTRNGKTIKARTDATSGRARMTRATSLTLIHRLWAAGHEIPQIWEARFSLPELALHRARREPLDHPTMDEHVERDHRHGGDDRGGHELAPVEDVAVDQQIETDRHRGRRLVGDEDQCIEK